MDQHLQIQEPRPEHLPQRFLRQQGDELQLIDIDPHEQHLDKPVAERGLQESETRAYHPTIVYADGSKWYDHIDNVRVKNPGTKIPHTSINDPNDNDRISDRYVEDGSFLRIKNITLGYTFPKALLNKAKIENLRVYVNIQNLYTFTKYTGYDPEVGASTQDSTGLTYGLDNGRYPSPAMYSFGLNITF